MLVKNVTFYSLPAEIRNKIFHAILETNVKFQIRVDHKDPGTISDLDPTTTALARVSKEVHADIIPIIYGSNTFDFGNLYHLHVFSQRIGAGRAHLRHISILDDIGLLTYPPTRNPFATLPQMTKLQSLTVNHESLYLHALPIPGKMRVEDFVRQLKPFLHAWHEANKDEPSSPSVLNLVRLVKRDFCSSDCGFELEGEAVICRVSWCSAGILAKVQKTGLKHLRKVSEKLQEMIAAELNLAQ